MTGRLGHLATLIAALTAVPAAARTLEVGPGLEFAAPSQAAAAAADGDTVAIAPGTYFDCAVWRANALNISATGPDAVITDRACEGKAAFVIRGDNVTITRLSFRRIRVSDGNGAGIRAEGHGLTVANSSFINSQAGIISATSGGALRIENCSFIEQGTPDGPPVHAVLANRLGLLQVSGSEFRQARGGADIASSAERTELSGNRFIDDGGTIIGPMVQIAGGVVIVDGNTVEAAPGPADRPGAILVFGETDALRVSGNTLIEPSGTVPLVRNWSSASATGGGNVVPPGVLAVSDEGATWHLVRGRAAAMRQSAGNAARIIRHETAEVARSLGLIR